ncbi:hypothetical protein FA95DRAFT_1653360 [Auriscalpium vulgare]|uniref:Uncharacterized protein n=1 Tax=Auriscalpium vulgare TaxID=40419 RepID=A0ACB8RX83_9AGAM|nr:hypothetical protein FA95DRAFT_1653360 [Auriscalpium vulgare]
MQAEQLPEEQLPGVDEPGSAQVVPVVQSEELWFSDGNIIIRSLPSGAPPIRAVYKVHRSILSLHCSAFAALFEGPKDEAFIAGSEHYEKLPLMDLPDDAEDLRHFLKALYFHEGLHIHTSVPLFERWRAPFPPSYPGILRLATKYDASKVRRILVDALQAQWPARLAAYDGMNNGMNKSVDEGPSFREDFPSDPGRAIRLATDFDIPDVLPFAYYALARLIASPELSKIKPGELTHLTPNELNVLILGVADLRVQTNRIISSTQGWTSKCQQDLVYDDEAEDDVSPCEHSLEQWVERQHALESCCGDPLAWLKVMSMLCMDIEDVCETCRVYVRTDVLVDARNRLWKTLPAVFGLVRCS